MANKVAEKHYIADEKLGGIEREYVEVNRKAVVGDYVVSDEQLGYVERVYEVYNVYPNGVLGKYPNGHTNLTHYKTLSPTENVRISNETGDGVIYRLVDRKAQEGENILHVYEDKSDGRVLKVTEVGTSVARIEPYEDIDEDGDNVEITGISHGFYRVLVPESKSAGSLHVEVTVDSEVITSLTDMLASLAVKVTEQQRELDVVKRQLRGNTSILSDRIDANTEDIRTFAEDLTEHKAEQADITEMLTGDIVSLDERTQPEELARAVSETISKGLAKGARLHGRG